MLFEKFRNKQERQLNKIYDEIKYCYERGKYKKLINIGERAVLKFQDDRLYFALFKAYNGVLTFIDLLNLTDEQVLIYCEYYKRAKDNLEKCIIIKNSNDADINLNLLSYYRNILHNYLGMSCEKSIRNLGKITVIVDEKVKIIFQKCLDNDVPQFKKEFEAFERVLERIESLNYN